MNNFSKRFATCITVVFLLILLLPNFGLFREKRNKELILEMETRVINPKPSASFFTVQYFKQFEDWYNDRLLGRKELVRGWAKINGRLFHTLISKEVEMGKEDFLFMPFNVKHELIDRDKKRAIMQKLADACTKHGAAMYFFLAPHSEWALQEYLPDKYGRFDLRTIDQEMVGFLPSGMKYITINDKLSAMSLEERNKLYYRGDYHWNAKAAHIAAKEILAAIGYNKDINKEVQFLKLKDASADIYTRNIGWKPIVNEVEKPWNDSFTNTFDYMCGTAGITKESSQKEADAYTHRGEAIIINPMASHKVTVLVMGDSFMGSLQEYLLQDVERLVVLHNSDISKPKLDIDIEYLLTVYKPNVVLYEKMGAFFYNHRYEEIFGNYKK